MARSLIAGSLLPDTALLPDDDAAIAGTLNEVKEARTIRLDEEHHTRARHWTARLRSVEIPQGTNHLCVVDEDDAIVGMCCLGVLCHEADPSRWRSTTGRDTNEHCIRAWGLPNGPEDSSFPPNTLDYLDWVSISHAAKARTGRTLSQLNDSGCTFAEIADLIDAVCLPA